VIGFEPITYNQQGIENKALTGNGCPVLSTNLGILLQKWPELKQIIAAWPELPEHIKTAVKALTQTENK